MTELEKFAHAFLVADDVLAKRAGAFRGSIFGIEIVSDERMPREIYALGHREGAVVVRSWKDLADTIGRVGSGEQSPPP